MAVAVSGPIDKLRDAFRSSAFVPANWDVPGNAAGAVGMICEVVLALDRQRAGRDAQNTDLRQHLYHHGAQSTRSQHGSSQHSKHHGGKHHSSQHGSQHHSSKHHRKRPDRHHHTRSRSLESGPSLGHPRRPPPAQGYGEPYSHQYENGGYTYQYNQGGYAQEYDQSFEPNYGVPPARHAAGDRPRSMARSQAPSHAEPPQRSSSRSSTTSSFMDPEGRVSVIDDRHSIFSRDTLARPLPAGTRVATGDSPVATKCPQCRQNIMTVIKRHTGGKNIAATVAVAAAGVAINAPATLLPLALTVLDLGSLKRRVHHCPYCDYKMGKHVTITIPRR
ncbi:hypothetical protein LPJ61_000435 [Coemansia biformis]|uniref:LITAF domain-containing protein n=1 Tax=Coemansia biformis TaxID=1286918 RepID=A0A9W7YIU4_9FUNG|nr:hypothetical protein LPJ61_000435 [Coemansia biformis]